MFFFSLLHIKNTFSLLMLCTHLLRYQQRYCLIETIFNAISKDVPHDDAKSVYELNEFKTITSYSHTFPDQIIRRKMVFHMSKWTQRMQKQQVASVQYTSVDIQPAIVGQVFGVQHEFSERRSIRISSKILQFIFFFLTIADFTSGRKTFETIGT